MTPKCVTCSVEIDYKSLKEIGARRGQAMVSKEEYEKRLAILMEKATQGNIELPCCRA